MDNKFTPGPWEAIRTVGSSFVKRVGYYKRIARLYLTETTRDEQEANAHPIAAAPEMYEALRNWHDMFEWGDFAIDFSNGITHQGCDEGDIKGNNMLSEFIQSTKAALQKARGEHG